MDHVLIGTTAIHADGSGDEETALVARGEGTEV